MSADGWSGALDWESKTRGRGGEQHIILDDGRGNKSTRPGIFVEDDLGPGSRRERIRVYAALEAGSRSRSYSSRRLMDSQATSWMPHFRVPDVTSRSDTFTPLAP